MKYRLKGIVGIAFVLGLCLGLAGCVPGPAEAPATAPVSVTVSYPVAREVTDYADYTGRTAAVDFVEVRARVWGFLDKVNFKEGALVKKGDVLFEIDPRTYKAAVAQAEGNLASGVAKLKRLDADFARAEKLLQANALSREDYDKIVGNRGEAAAALDALRAAVEQAKLDLGFTKVDAPISGRVSQKLVTEGNLVQSGQSGGTVLTTIVSVDPIYVYIDVDEHTVQYVRKLIREGKAKSARDEDLPITLGIANDEGFPHRGSMTFVDNRVNPKTGTLRLRGVFPNKDDILSPGYFARVRVPIGFAHQALLITDRAIDTDLGQKIVYVVDNENKVLSRAIRPGALHDRLRVIDEGLSPTDKVIVSGLQQIRPGVLVEPKLVEMPNPKSDIQNPNQPPAENLKFDIRNQKQSAAENPKSEIRNPKQIQISKSQ